MPKTNADSVMEFQEKMSVIGGTLCDPLGDGLLLAVGDGVGPDNTDQNICHVILNNHLGSETSRDAFPRGFFR